MTAPRAIEAPTKLVVDGYTRIPAGTFPMGSWDDEEEVQGTTRFDEHRVAVTLTHDFFIKTTEVTQGESSRPRTPSSWTSPTTAS